MLNLLVILGRPEIMASLGLKRICNLFFLILNATEISACASVVLSRQFRLPELGIAEHFFLPGLFRVDRDFFIFLIRETQLR